MTLLTRNIRLTILTVLAFLFAFSAASYAQTATYMYDELNRLKRVEYSNGAVVEYSYDGAGNRLQVLSPDTTPPTTTATPAGGLYSANQSVTLTCDDGSGSGCDKIYYTTNGTTPTTSSPVYTAPISATANIILSFFAQDRDGNSETVKTQTYTIDKTAPTGSLAINSGASATNSIDVTLTLTCNDANGCSQMQFTNDYGTYSAPESFAGTKQWTLTSGENMKTVSVKFKDSAGNWSSPMSSSIRYDITPPTGTMSINYGAAATNSATVNLYPSCSDASTCYRMKFSNDDATYSTPVAMASMWSWNLPPGDGTKTVYAKFMDMAGNWTNAYSRTIILDTVVPATTASPVGGAYSAAQAVTLTCNDGTGSGCDKIYYTTNGSTPTTSSAVYSSPLNITATTTVKYFAKDIAGNSETVKTQVYTVDATPPTGSLSINSGAASTSNASVTLTLSCTDTGTSCSQMRFSNDDTTYSAPETYSGTRAWILTSGDGSKTVYVKYSDLAGNWSQALSATILLDTAVPSTAASPAGGTFTTFQTVTLTCSDTGSGCNRTYYTTNGSAPSTSSPVYSSPLTIMMPTTVNYFSTDRAGNSEAMQSQFYNVNTTSTDPPGIQNITPGVVFTGVTTTVVITGASLFTTQSITSDASLTINVISATDTQITATVTASPQAALGAHNITFTTAYGTTSSTLSVSPSQLSFSPDGVFLSAGGTGVITASIKPSIGQPLTLWLNNNNPVVASCPDSITIPASGTGTFQVSAVGEGGSALITSSGAGLSVYIEPPFVPISGQTISRTHQPCVRLYRQHPERPAVGGCGKARFRIRR